MRIGKASDTDEVIKTTIKSVTILLGFNWHSINEVWDVINI